MSRRKKRMAPGANQDHSNTTTCDTSLADKSTSRADHRALIDHVYVLVLDVETPAGIRTRRTTYFSLRTAQRALDRATMRGQVASVILARLVPVDGGDAQ